MKHLVFSLVGLSLALMMMTSCQTAPRSMSEAREGVNFTAFATFAVLPIPLDAKISDPPLGPNAMQQMNARVTERFLACGYRLAEVGQADLQIALSGQIVSRTEKHEWGYTPERWNWSRYRGLERYDVEVGNKGTLIVDVLRRSDGELLWRGWASRDINGYLPEDKALLRDLEKILAQFPPSPPAKN